MRIFNGYKSCRGNISRCIIAIGNFDGFHLGHKKILKKLILISKKLNIQSGVYTFNPHPSLIINNKKKILLIDNYKDKIEKILNFGVDFIIDEPFNEEFRNITYKDFVKNILFSSLNVNGVVVGSNYHFGKSRSGDITSLNQELRKYNIFLKSVSLIKFENTICSSSKIRELIINGELLKASKLLGREYCFFCDIIKKNNTVYIIIKNDFLLEAGFYKVILEVNKDNFFGIINIISYYDLKNHIELKVKIKLFKFHDNLQGKHVKIKFIDKIICDKII